MSHKVSLNSFIDASITDQARLFQDRQVAENLVSDLLSAYTNRGEELAQLIHDYSATVDALNAQRLSVQNQSPPPEFITRAIANCEANLATVRQRKVENDVILNFVRMQLSDYIPASSSQ